MFFKIVWNCDYDLFWRQCLPVYSFKRFDSKFIKPIASAGFNFRFTKSNYFSENIEHRVLYKAYGLRFIISVSGTAGMFSIVPLMLKIGAGIGLLSLSVIMADCVMLNCHKRRNLFKYIKDLDYLQVTRV